MEFLSILKQYALFFDKIHIPDLGALAGFYGDIIVYPWNYGVSDFSIVEWANNELNWLQEKDLIEDFEVKKEYFDKADDLTTIREFRKLCNQSYVVYDGITNNIINGGAPTIEHMEAARARMYCIALREIRKENGILLFGSDEFSPIGNLTKSTEVANVLIRQFPVPDKTITWDQIIEFRSDTDARADLINLRRWMRRISEKKLSKNEIEEELEWLMSEFMKHMRLHRIKANIAMFETMLKIPLELIENLVSIKWSKLVDPLFAISKRKVSLLEAEMKAPGREMAYLVKSKERFGMP